MSGGFFDYKDSSFYIIADSIEEVIRQNNSNERYNYPPDVIEKFKETVKQLREIDEKVKGIDLLLSGDSGIESFRKGWKEELGEY